MIASLLLLLYEASMSVTDSCPAGLLSLKTARMPSFSKAVIGSYWGVLEGVGWLSRSAKTPVESDVVGALPPNRSARLVGFEAGICPIPPSRSSMACLPPERHTATGKQPTNAVQNQEQQDDGAVFLAALPLKGHTCAIHA